MKRYDLIFWMRRCALIVMYLAGGLLVTSATGAAADSKAAPRRDWSRVILTYRGTWSSEREARLRRAGADVYRHLPIIHAVAVRVPVCLLERINALPFVSHLSADMAVQKCDQFTVGSSLASTAWQYPYNLSGSGVNIAILDSGIHPLLDLSTQGLLGTFLLSQPRIAASISFVSGDSSTEDGCGHGTHVAGIIAGNAASSTGLTCFKSFYGIAPKSQVVNVRVLNGVGEGNVSDVVAGIQWVVNNRSTYKIRVMNLSLGHPAGESYTTDPLCQAVEAAWKAGIVVVCAAGNDGRLNVTQTSTDNEGWGTAYGSIQCPGNDPYVITVGATKSMDGKRADDRIATYSSRGPTRLDLVLKPDIIAPGNKVISTLVAGSYLANNFSATNKVPYSYYSLSLLGGNSNTYFVLSGTSMATPVVAGAAALMLQAHPTLTPDTIKARLMLSADKWGFPDGTGDACTFGAGYLNIPAALSNRAVATQPALSPTLYRDAQGDVHINATSIVGGSQYIWGVANLTGLQYIWGTQYIWGNNTLSSSQYIWGDSVWTDQYIWGTSSADVDLTATALTGDP